MRAASFLLSLSLALFPAGAFSTSAPQEPPKPPQAEKVVKPDKSSKPEPVPKVPDAEKELARAVEDAGNDSAARVRNLEDYLKRFPDAPRKAEIFRAIIQAAVELRDNSRTLDYAERLIAIRPDDSGMLLFAVDLLEKLGDEKSLTKAVGYVSRVLDRIEKDPGENKPVRVSVADWELERKKLRMSVYLIRGRLEMQRKNHDAAASDLEKSYSILPNTPAALRLGDLAELRKEYEKAIEHYSIAFVLPDSYGTLADQRDARRKLGNLWRIVHGSEAGLGDQLLVAYDRVVADATKSDAPVYNLGVKEPFEMEVRRLTGPPLKMAELKGKVVVLYFWATWCGPCRELEPLMESAFEKYSGKSEVVFLAVNRDEDETLVAPFIKKEKMPLPIVFSDGLERPLRVEAIPTVVVCDRAGKIVYRSQGFEPEGFLDALTSAIDRALPASSLP